MHLRAAASADLALLEFLLLEAYNWDETARFTRTQLLADAHAKRYLDGWMRAKDFGVVAIEHHQPLGALWARPLPVASPGYGYVGDDVPELSMAVAPEHRGRGVGTALLEGGFVVVGRNGDSDTMVREL